MMTMACVPAAAQPGRLNGQTFTMSGGITVRLSTVAEPPFAFPQEQGQHGVFFKVTGNVMQRAEFDGGTNSYFGYDLVVDPAGAGQFRVAIQPPSLLPQNLPERLRHHALTLTVVSLPKYPDPQVIRDGDTIALDLLVSPDGQQKVVDYIQIMSSSTVAKSFTTIGAFSGSAAPKNVKRTFGQFSDRPGMPAPKDFTLDDLTLSFEPPCAWLVNGKELRQAYSVERPSGSILWFYFPGRGRYILSLATHTGYEFQKAGAIRDNVVSFRWQGDEYEIRSASPILGTGKAWTLYVLHDPAYRPKVDSESNALLAGADRLENLLTR